jgi:putative ABC transport system ATP-binding protein
MVELRDVNKDYPLGKLTVRALKGVDVVIEKGEFTVIMGPSGSGKTTLLNLIGCMDKPTTGQVFVDGESTTQLNDRRLTNLRLHKLGFIFQNFNLIPVLNVFQNVEFPLLLQGGYNRHEREKRVYDMISKVELTEQITQRPNELSGGQRQRVAIARALVGNPKIVLADEPTANLDSQTGINIIDLMKEINQQLQTTFIFSTHDFRVMDHARRIIKLVDGMIADNGQSGHN